MKTCSSAAAALGTVTTILASNILTALLRFPGSVTLLVCAFWAQPLFGVSEAAATGKSAGFLVGEKACLWMPEPFRQVIGRHLPGLERGAGQFPALAFLSASERLRLEGEAMRRMNAVVERLRSQPRFQQIAEDFGALAQMALLMNLPEPEGSTIEEIAALLGFIRSNHDAFRLVVYEAAELGAGQEPVQKLFRGIRNRRQGLSERFRQQAVRGALARPSGRLDPKSALYGVASLVYSHSINDTASIWLWVWKTANGDMSGRPAFDGP